MEDKSSPSGFGGELDRSNWWYGIAVPVVCGLVGRGWMTMLDVLGIQRNITANLFIAAPVFAVFVANGLAPLFVVALFKDARTVRAANARWNPNLYLWGGAGLLTVVVGAAYTVAFGDLFPFDLVSTPLGLLYLSLRRRRAITVPTPAELDDQVPDDTTATVAEDDITASDESNARPSTVESKWWYGVAGTLALFGFGLLLIVVTVALAFAFPSVAVSPGTGTKLLTVPLGTVLVSIAVGFFLVPFYSLGLYKDVKAIEAADVEWSPSRLYLGVAGVHLAGIFPLLLPAVSLVTIPAGGYYLYQRRSHVGTP